MNAAKILLLPFIFFFTWQAQAQVQWNEPEVVPEKLVRANRRVLRFSGSTQPGGQVRIGRNKIKMYLDSGKVRWAKIPQKNKLQFPVVADDNGEFSFDLYLPTVAVEIPIQVLRGSKWIPYSLNFRVPDEGAADDFQAVEESFQASADDVEKDLEKQNYYSRKDDRGQYANGAGKRGPVEFWGGLGMSYFSNTVKTPNEAIDLSESTLVLPTFKVGVNWDYDSHWRGVFALRSSSGSFELSGPAVIGDDFSWFEFQVGSIYFMDALKMRSGRLGIDFGVGQHTLPFFRIQSAALNGGAQSFFDNDVFMLHVGLFYETSKKKKWPYEIYARYFYPLTTGDAFDIDSSFPMTFEFGGGLRRQLTPGLAFGVYAQLEYFSMDLTYLDTGATEYSAMLMTADARLIMNF